MDLNAWVKHKYLGRYDEISAEDKKYFHPTLIERGARATTPRLAQAEWAPMAQEAPPPVTSLGSADRVR